MRACLCLFFSMCLGACTFGTLQDPGVSFAFSTQRTDEAAILRYLERRGFLLEEDSRTYPASSRRSLYRKPGMLAYFYSSYDQGGAAWPSRRLVLLNREQFMGPAESAALRDTLTHLANDLMREFSGMLIVDANLPESRE